MIYEFHSNLNKWIISDSSVLQRCFWRLLLNVYRRFDSQILVVLECLTLQLSRYSTSKCSCLPTSWHNDVRSQKTWNHIVIAVITCNVASKLYCLLQVLVAALLLVSCFAFERRYPDPLDCHKYYLRINDSFYHLTCPNSLFFNQYSQQCTLNKTTTLYIPPLPDTNCNQNVEGYYCNSLCSFTYCTHDSLIIVNANCTSGLFCRGFPNTKPCVT
jgi:hypothetical protein